MHDIRFTPLLLLVLLCGWSNPKAQNVIQLIGFEADNSSFSKESYAVMYDNDNKLHFEGTYTPYFTLGIVRKDNEISIFKQPYLIVPTNDGFKYITQEVYEEKNDTTEAEEDFELQYNYRSSTATPSLFSKKEEIRSFIKSQKPSFEDAINVSFKKISFITPYFYITEGFDSDVHGGATWFNATETSEVHSLNPKSEYLSNHLTNYLKRRQLNPIIIDAATKTYGGDGEVIDEKYILPWGSQVNALEDIYFTFQYENNQVKIVPLVLLNGNSARSFLFKGKPFENPAILDKFSIKQPVSKTANELEFISPDNSTRVLISNKSVSVYDNASNRLLAKKPIDPFNKTILSEWALNRFTDKWADEFK